MDYPTGIGYVPQEEGLLRGSPSLLLRSPSEDRSRQKLLYAPCFFWAVVKPHRYRYQSSVTEPPQFVQQAPFGAMLHIVRGTVATAETVSHVASPLPCISVYQCVLRSAIKICYAESPVITGLSGFYRKTTLNQFGFRWASALRNWGKSSLQTSRSVLRSTAHFHTQFCSL